MLREATGDAYRKRYLVPERVRNQYGRNLQPYHWARNQGTPLTVFDRLQNGFLRLQQVSDCQFCLHCSRTEWFSLQGVTCLMPAMENPYPHLGQPLVPVFPAQQAYDSAAVYNIPPAAQPPPPPKWPQSKNLQGKRGGYNKHNFRMPSTKVNIKRIRKQNAQGTRGYVGKGASSQLCWDVCAVKTEH